jgi:hypothetical protein
LNGFPAALCAGVAIWCSLGTIAVLGPSTSSRVALLAPWWVLPLSIVLVFAGIRVLRLSPRQQSPLFGSAVLVLPWLPFPVPAAALLWTGPFMVAIWVAVIVGVLIERTRGAHRRWFTVPPRAPIACAMLSLALYGASAAWLSPIFPDGDEPHYLILAQSLIKDGDLRIENNHRRGDYLEYSLNAAAPDYLRRGTNGEIYSIHAPGLAVLIAPAMWLGGYPCVVAFLAVVAALSTGLVWYIAFRTTGSAACAWFGWGCCAVTTPLFFQATEVFPDGLAATCLLIGTLPLWTSTSDDQRASSGALWLWSVAGAALAILPWLQTRLVVLAIAAAVCLCLRVRHRRQLVAFVAVPAISAALWFGFFVVVYGTPNPAAPYGPYTQTSVANLVRGIPGLLFDQQFGLILNAPVYGLVIVAVLAGAATLQRWSWETLALTVPYVAAVGTYQMWWGGTSVPARLLAPITFVLGLAAARIWREIHTPEAKSLGILALIASALITLTLLFPDRGRLLLNFRDGISLWLEWANDVLDLPKGLPSIFRDNRALLWLKVVVWGSTIAAMWLVLRVARSRGGAVSGRVNSDSEHRREVSLSWHTTWSAAVALMIAFTLAWQVDGAQPLTPATAVVNILRHATPIRSQAYDYGASHFEPADALLSSLRLGTDRQRRPAASPTLFEARDLPAGAYRLQVESRRPNEGTLVVHAGSSELSLRVVSVALAENGSSDAVLRLPTSVRSLTVDGDAAAARAGATLELVPLPSAVGLVDNAGESAHRAVHYESADVFFLDEQAYPEPTGFWVAGGRTAVVTIANRGDHQELHVRNAPVDNQIVVSVNGEMQELTLGPGEERQVTLPHTPDGRPLRVRITSRNGFRPSTTEPGSADLRYLGCWVDMR